MQNVLADLAIESEAATAAALRVARAYDDGRRRPFRRFATAVMKYWVCKRAAATPARRWSAWAATATSRSRGMPLLYRDAPLMSIWEGSGNVARSTCCARMAQGARGRCRRSWRSASWRPAPTPRLDAHLAALTGRGSRAALEDADAQLPRAPRGRGPRRGAAGLPARAPRAAGGRRRVLRRPARRRGRPLATARCRRASTPRDHRPRAGRGCEHARPTRSTGRVARITLDRPERGNGITLAMPRELAACVERADLDPAVHVIALAGNGKGFCGGYDLVESAEADAERRRASRGSPLDPTIASNHDPRGRGTRWSTTR